MEVHLDATSSLVLNVLAAILGREIWLVTKCLLSESKRWPVPRGKERLSKHLAWENVSYLDSYCLWRYFYRTGKVDIIRLWCSSVHQEKNGKLKFHSLNHLQQEQVVRRQLMWVNHSSDASIAGTGTLGSKGVESPDDDLHHCHFCLLKFWYGSWPQFLFPTIRLKGKYSRLCMM